MDCDGFVCCGKYLLAVTPALQVVEIDLGHQFCLTQ